MITTARRALACCLLLWVYLPAQGAVGATQQARRSVTLTNRRPVGYFDLAPQILASPSPILFLSITRVVNPQRTPCEVLVYLVRVRSDEAKQDKVRVGSFALYPADKPAGFQLSASKAFTELEATAGTSRSNPVKIELELRRVHGTQPWTTVELTVAEPDWRSSEPQVPPR